MTEPSICRDLTLGDVACLLATVASRPAIGALDVAAGIARETCGYRLLTVLRYDEPAGEVVRVYSSDPAYPVGGRKSLAQYTANHAAMAQGGIFLAATRADVRDAYADHDRLFAMGITAILNAQVRISGRRLGTLNLSGAEGSYGAREVAIARILADALAPSLLGEAHGAEKTVDRPDSLR